MFKTGIIGYPLGHTLSPVMHKAAFEYTHLEGDYIVLETPPDDLISRIKYLKVNSFNGFNVTIPLKVWIVPLLNDVDEYANIAGAVNTVVISENKEMKGYNTDIEGFIKSIPENLRENLKGKKGAVFGSGGAARAVAVSLALMGISEITVFARNRVKAIVLKDVIKENFLNAELNTKEYNEFSDLSEYSIIVNATPLGMKGEHEGISPVNKISIYTLPADTIIYDLVYTPKHTQLMRYAETAGLTAIGGLEMLVLQGAAAWSLWTNREAPVDIMRDALIRSLKT